jgi:hypothetical protein
MLRRANASNVSQVGLDVAPLAMLCCFTGGVSFGGRCHARGSRARTEGTPPSLGYTPSDLTSPRGRLARPCSARLPWREAQLRALFIVPIGVKGTGDGVLAGGIVLVHQPVPVVVDGVAACAGVGLNVSLDRPLVDVTGKGSVYHVDPACIRGRRFRSLSVVGDARQGRTFTRTRNRRFVTCKRPRPRSARCHNLKKTDRTPHCRVSQPRRNHTS